MYAAALGARPMVSDAIKSKGGRYKRRLIATGVRHSTVCRRSTLLRHNIKCLAFDIRCIRLSTATPQFLNHCQSRASGAAPRTTMPLHRHTHRHTHTDKHAHTWFSAPCRWNLPPHSDKRHAVPHLCRLCLEHASLLLPAPQPPVQCMSEACQGPVLATGSANLVNGLLDQLVPRTHEWLCNSH